MTKRCFAHFANLPFLRNFALSLKGFQIVALESPVKPVPRYGYGKPLHPRLYEIISRNRISYENTLKSFLRLVKHLLKIPVRNSNNRQEPCWINAAMPGLDSVALYSFLSLRNPRRYFEIGSGFSTRFARRAILDHGLRTEITSIDPNPGIDIDSICDTIIRQPLEDVDLGVFDSLESGDVLFVDGTHRCSMNSDVSVVFLDILPELPTGMLVEFHDIFLPYDYPRQWGVYYYSEQYLLATYILAEGKKFNIVLPNYYITRDPALSHTLGALWNRLDISKVCSRGGSFWIETKENRA